MDILNVNSSLDPVWGGGTSERTIQVSRHLQKAGVNCTILTTDLGFSNERLKDLGDVQCKTLHCIFKRFFIPKFSYRDVEQLVKRADVIHLMSHWTVLNAIVYSIAVRLKKPYVVCPAGALPIYGRSKRIKNIYNRVIGRNIIRNASGHVAITGDEIPHFMSYGVAEEKISIIPNGTRATEDVADDELAFRKKYGLGKYPFLLFVGRLNPIKGPDMLLKAFCNVRNALEGYHLVFAGPNEGLLADMRRFSIEQGLQDRVHFIGYLRGADKVHAYRAAEILVVPSRQDAMSIVVLEAGIEGTPVLLTDQCGFNDVSKVGGGMVVPASVEGLQRGLGTILNDRDRLRVMGANLAQYVREHFTWDVMAQKYVELYSSILDQ